MKFVYPQVLWALLFLLIPIVIHLFNFKKYKTLYFSSLHFLKKVDEQARSTKQLKKWLVLISRLLAFASIIFAFAQPYWVSEGDRSSPDQPILIHIDNSFSMQAQGSSGELLSIAKEKCRDLIKSQSHDQLFIISSNSLSGREERLLNRSDAMEKIDNLAFSAMSRSLSSVVEWQQNVIDKLDPESIWAQPHSYYFSDFQTNTIGSGLTETTDLKFTPVLLQPENSDNLYIDSVWFSDPVNRLGKMNQLNVRVRNNSSEDLSNVEMEFAGDNENRILFLDIGANSSVESSINVGNNKYGMHAGSVRIADQNIYFDDTYYYCYFVEKKAKVLIVNGEDATDNVAVIYSLDDYYQVENKESSAVTRDDITEKDLIILNGLNDLASGVEALIKDALKSGTSVGIFPGKAPNHNSWNPFLSSYDLPLFLRSASSAQRIRDINYADPFFNGVFESKPEKIKLPQIRFSFASSASGNSGNQLIRLQNGTSLLSYAKPNGNLFVFYSSLHSDFGNFANDALCSTLFLRMGEFSKRQRPLQITIGSSSVYPVFVSLQPEDQIRIMSEKINLIPSRYEINGVQFINIKNITGIDELIAGNYDLIGEKKLGVLSMNYSRKESDLQYLSSQQIARVFDKGESASEIKVISSSQEFDVNDDSGSSGIWRIMVIFALLFLGMEMLLVRFLK